MGLGSPRSSAVLVCILLTLQLSGYYGPCLDPDTYDHLDVSSTISNILVMVSVEWVGSTVPAPHLVQHYTNSTTPLVHSLLIGSLISSAYTAHELEPPSLRILLLFPLCRSTCKPHWRGCEGSFQSSTLLTLLVCCWCALSLFLLWYLTQCHRTPPAKLHITQPNHSVLAILQDVNLLRSLGPCDRPRNYIHHVVYGAYRCRIALHSATNVESWLMV